jgi:hypothetical protein
VCHKCELVQCNRWHLAPGRRMRCARVGSGKCVRIGRVRRGMERKRMASGRRHTTRKSAEKRGRSAQARTFCPPCEIETDRQQKSLLLSIPRLDARLIRVLVVIIIGHNYFHRACPGRRPVRGSQRNVQGVSLYMRDRDVSHVPTHPGVT